MNKEGYTWEDLDKAWWEGFDNAKSKMEKRIAELEQQIEKMKRCAICKHSTDLGYCKIRCGGGECDNYSSWEIKEE